jgi:putative cardiolipin synthase
MRGVFRWLGLFVVLAALLAGCATLREDVPPGKPSHALAPDPEAPLGRLAARHLASVGGASAFRLLESGQAALAARLALIEQARHSLDLQYYIFRNDTSGKLLMDALIRAAERGVRVRLLLDDMYSPENEAVIVGLDAHARIQVRLYNPFRVRGNAPLGRFLEYLGGGGHLNRRMHNKLFLADNHFGITGGRNIGDEYFQADDAVAFRDLDVLATGAIVPELSAAFDRYWNAEQVVTARALPHDRPRQELRETLRAEVTALRTGLNGKEDGLMALDVMGEAAGPGWRPWTAGRASVLMDDPAKTRDQVEAAHLPMQELLRQGTEVRQELLIASPYFVPRKKGVAWLRQIHANEGVRVRVLTNSLAATDVALVHAGYARYRLSLLDAGVELHELKPLRERGAWGPALASGSSRASLHGKAVVFDRKVAYVGSMNLDPRSVLLNTESGLLLYGEALAGQVADFIEQAMRPERSYLLAVRRVPDETGESARLTWLDRRADGEVVHQTEPRTRLWLRGYIRALSLLPLEEEL